MGQTKIKASKQIFYDDNVDLNGKRLTNAGAGVDANDLVTKSQLDSATGGEGTSLHTPVADLAAAKAIGAAGRADRMLLNIESLGLYRFDAESTAASNDNQVIRPTDVASDASPGRWLKMSSTLNDHNLMSNIQGGTTGEYNHLTDAEKAAATRNASGSQSGLLSSADWTTFNGKLGTSNYVNRETPSGTKNGSNTVFTLAFTPVSGTEMVYLNGMLLEPGAGNDYTISSNSITFADAPASTDKILVTYWK